MLHRRVFVLRELIYITVRLVERHHYTGRLIKAKDELFMEKYCVFLTLVIILIHNIALIHNDAQYCALLPIYSFIDNCLSKSAISWLIKAERGSDARCSVLICFMALKLRPSVVLLQLKFLFIVCRQGNLCVGRFQEEICATRQ